jgi:hypothetical protein
MKIFGGNKKGEAQEDGDYFDSPSETIPLTAQAPPKKEAPPPEEPPRARYGIEDAIQLMRALPVDQNVELVVQVIKTTLESMRVKVSDIISDASRKQKELEERVSELKRAIVDFEKEIQTRKDEIARLEADHTETSSVRQRLELAERAQKPMPKSTIAAAGAETAH